MGFFFGMRQMNNTALITGISRGLGRGLAEVFSAEGFRVLGCSRTGEVFNTNIHHQACDLSQTAQINHCLETLLANVTSLDVVILNAGIVGDIKDMSMTSVEELEKMMTVNVWSNKLILDYLLQSAIQIGQIILMSSGAAVLGSRGMGGYALSKAALNMLTKLYAHEFASTHIVSIAPGLIDTDMMNYLCNDTDSETFPALQRLKDARGTDSMQTPEVAARKILESLPALKNFASGSFVDLRQIFAPHEYAELMKISKTPN